MSGGGVGTWAARGLAILVGAVLGMAIGHGLAWSSGEPLPDDVQAHAIASRFVHDATGSIVRDRQTWLLEPTGWSGHLLGYRTISPGQVSVRFPADSDSPLAQHEYVATVAEQLRQAGWTGVWVDESYPALRAHHAGYEVRYGAVLGDPTAAGTQPVRGVSVDIRPDTPAAAGAGLLIGGLLGAGIAGGLVVMGQRTLRRRPPGVVRLTRLLFWAGIVCLAPATLTGLGFLYLFVVEELPDEPLWFAYSLIPTRIAGIVGAALLVAAAVATAATSRGVRQGQPGPEPAAGSPPERARPG